MFAQLNSISDSLILSNFINENQKLIEEFALSTFEIQRKQQEDFKNFVLLKKGIIESLDFNQSYNRAFVLTLLDFAERINARSSFVQLYQIVQSNGFIIGSRLEAARLYLYNIPNNQTYIDRFDDICLKLQNAINEEEDNDNKVIASFLNYYSSVINNTAPHKQFANAIQTKALAFSNKYPFLQSEVIQKTLLLDINETQIVYTTIQANLDILLGKKEPVSIFSNECFIIENDTEYSNTLTKTEKSFDSIRRIAVDKISAIQNQNDVFYSLKRGVAIIEKEEQLYAYLNSYGIMHKEKLIQVLKHIPFDSFHDDSVDVFDWSCGQGLASIVLFEFLYNNSIILNIDTVVLIEPSELALKRAALHVRHFDSQCKLQTIKKDMDSLTCNDIRSSDKNVKIHLFSNILDVESFSMQHLVNIIKMTQKGVNYFICVSPCINDIKTARIDGFVNEFSGLDGFNMIYRCKAYKGEWSNNWTKLIRLFCVNI